MITPTLIRVACPMCAGTRHRPERMVRDHPLKRCCDCGFVFANPRYSPADLDRIYNGRDPEMLINLYARIQASCGNSEHDRILREIEELLPGSGRLLDFGCGPGYFYEHALKRGWEAHGWDTGAWVAEAATRRGLRNIHVGPLADQGFSDGYFDVICANQVLEHLTSPREELADLCRLLRPGGLFYANVPNYRCLSIVLGCDDFELNTPPQHVNYFTPTTLQSLLEGSNLHVYRMSTFGGLKWENLFGRRTKSSVGDAYRAVNERTSKGSPSPPLPPARASRLKLLVFPLVKATFYRLAKVGLVLEVFARKP